MIVTQRIPIQDLHHTVDSDVRAWEGVVAVEAYRKMVRMGYLANDGQRPDGKLVDAVVLVIADHQNPMLATSTQQGPDLPTSHQCESRRAMSLLSSISARSASTRSTDR